MAHRYCSAEVLTLGSIEPEGKWGGPGHESRARVLPNVTRVLRLKPAAPERLRGQSGLEAWAAMAAQRRARGIR